MLKDNSHLKTKGNFSKTRKWQSNMYTSFLYTKMRTH